MEELFDRKITIPSNCSLPAAEIIVIGIPYDSAVTGLSGAKNAPSAIREAFSNYLTFDMGRKRHVFDKKIYDLGNIVCIKNIANAISEIRKVNKRAKILFIGGDHSITYSISKSLDITSLLSLDAHFDIMDDFKGNRFSHATVMRRIIENGKKVVFRGVRSSSESELKFVTENHIDWNYALDFSGKVDYLSIDVDVLDPTLVGTGYPEPLGCAFQDLIKQIRNVKFKYCDIVEWIPPYGFGFMRFLLKELLLDM